MATVRELITKISFQYNGQNLQRAQRAVDQLLRSMRNMNRQQPRIHAQADTTQAELRLRRLREHINNINSQRIRIRDEVGTGPRIGGPSGNTSGSGTGSGFMGGLGVGGMTAGAMAGAALAASVTAAGAAAYSATMKFASFDATMSKVKALTNASDKDMKTLADTAQQLGATTKYSATEAAEAMTYLGMAGWKTNEIIKGMPGLLSLAAASGTDLATTADIVSDDLTAFHMSADQAAHMADVMAVASTNANTNVNLMGMTFKYAGAVAGSLGYSLEDVALATGLMANAGIKGEMAGTALRSVMTRMIDPPKQAAAALDQLGISAKNSDGTVKPFRQQLQELRKAFAGLSKAEQAEKASSIAGLEAMSGFLSVVTASDADFNKLADAIDHSAGASEKAAATMNDNLLGSLTELGSAAESVALKFGKVLEPSARKAVNAIKEEVSGLSTFMDETSLVMNASEVKSNYPAEVKKIKDEISKAEDQLTMIGKAKNLSDVEVKLLPKLAVDGLDTKSIEQIKAKLGNESIDVLAKVSAGKIDASELEQAKKALADKFTSEEFDLLVKISAGKVNTSELEQIKKKLSGKLTSEEIEILPKLAGVENIKKQLSGKLSAKDIDLLISGNEIKRLREAKQAMKELEDSQKKLANAEKDHPVITEWRDSYKRAYERDDSDNKGGTFGNVDPGSMGLIAQMAECWATIVKYTEKFSELLSNKLGNEIKWIAGLFTDDLLGEWEVCQTYIQTGIQLLQDAFKRLEPFIEAITPLLQVIVDVVGTALVWALKTLLVIGTAAFTGIAAVIDTAAACLEVFGRAVRVVANELEYALNKAMEFFQWLGLIEQKQGANYTSKFNWDPFSSGGGNTNTVNQENSYTFHVSSPGEARNYLQAAQESNMPTFNLAQ